MTKHSSLGASQFARLLACNGSYYLSQEIPKSDREDSTHAREGTLAHDLAEQKLKAFYGIPSKQIDLEVGEENDWDLDEMNTYTDDYVEYVTKLAGHDAHTTIGIEKKVILDERLKMYGTADFVSWSTKTDTVHIVDFKYGAGVDVDAVDNIQILYYMCAAWKGISRLANTKHITKFVGHVYQPRVENVITTVEYSLEQVQKYTKQFVQYGQDIVDIKTPTMEHFNVSKHCRFCPAIAICEKQREQSGTKALQVLVEDNTEVSPKELVLKIPDETLAKLIIHDKDITKLIAEAKAYAQSRFESGKPIAGLKRVSGPQRRKWKKGSEEIIKSKLIKGGCENPTTEKLIGITAADKILSEKEMEALVDYTKASKLIVSANDKRAALPEKKAIAALLEEEK